MKTFFASLSLGVALLVLSTLPGCKVEVADDGLPYTCASDADCGGEGLKCVLAEGRTPFCCESAPETCNGVDDDCDAAVDELAGDPCYSGPEGTRGVGRCKAGQPACGENNTVRCAGEVLPAAAELCNSLDDDCDGAVDEGFALHADNANCGRCGRACTPQQMCVAGECEGRVETACTDDADNDNDGQKDCADPDCTGVACGEGRVCINAACGEALCGNDVNEDGDAQQDCADPDCEGVTCGTGCTCTGNVKKETDCSDKVNNDNLEGADCADPDCTSCGFGCACVNSVAVERVCGDGEDNDKDGKRDCADEDCNNQACAATGCKCVFPNATETRCGDGADNDARDGADCADPDCQPGTTTDVFCVGGSPQEILCSNGQDEDNDGKVDCGTTDAPADENCQSSAANACGAGCQIVNCKNKETNCEDRADNDNTEGADCADVQDCPANTVCSINATKKGRCGTGNNAGKCV
jgi:hypothetical protein